MSLIYCTLLVCWSLLDSASRICKSFELRERKRNIVTDACYELLCLVLYAVRFLHNFNHFELFPSPFSKHGTETEKQSGVHALVLTFQKQTVVRLGIFRGVSLSRTQ
jgi:hypothetical protein